MANMSYCRFENTSSDLRDCRWALRDGEGGSLAEFKRGLSSDHERRGFESLREECVAFLKLYGEMAEVEDQSGDDEYESEDVD